MKVGVFDSGMGGLTILQSLVRFAPEYDYLYLGDNARTPYGTRSFETILKFTIEAVAHLFEKNCEIIVIACNTASAKALRTIQQTWLPANYPDRRVLGVIRPSSEAMSTRANDGPLAIWATPGTVKSESYIMELKKLAPQHNVVQIACPMLVPLVENGELTGEGTQFFVKKYWAQTVEKARDTKTLLLACTHYPMLLPILKRTLPKHLNILEQGEIVGPSWKDYLIRHPKIESRLTKNSECIFLTTDEPENFEDLAKMFLCNPVKASKVSY